MEAGTFYFMFIQPLTYERILKAKTFTHLSPYFSYIEAGSFNAVNVNALTSIIQLLVAWKKVLFTFFVKTLYLLKNA
jgi:hypothetical protein